MGDVREHLTDSLILHAAAPQSARSRSRARRGLEIVAQPFDKLDEAADLPQRPVSLLRDAV
jgi:hypothetical protein